MRLFPQRVERLFQEIQEIPLAPVVSKNLFNVIEVKELWNVHCPLSLNEMFKIIKYQIIVVGPMKNKPRIVSIP